MGRIAVIGAGMGSLTAAARLAAAGHDVVVCERAETHGGGVGRLERDGFAFDTGPGLLLLPAVYRDLFVKTGKASLEKSVTLAQADPSACHLLADGRAVTLPNASRGGVVAALDAAFGAGAGERWSEVMNRARGVWEVTRRPLLEDTLAADTTQLLRDPYPPVRRGPLRRPAPATIASVGRGDLRDPGLAALLHTMVLDYGLDPGRAPAGAVVVPYMEQTFGTWYVLGGLRALADAVYARCLERGVTFRFGTRVTGVVKRDGAVCGVDLEDGTREEAATVVDGSPRTALEGDTGRLNVLLALRGPRPPGTVHRTFVHGLAAPHDGSPGAPAPTVTVLRPTDPSLVPDGGHEAVRLSVTVRPHGPGGVDWQAPGYASAFAERVVAAALAAVPDLRERELWREVRTPADTERVTGVPGGAVPGPALAGDGGAHLRAANRAQPRGLFRVGGTAHPGGGLPHAGMSGAIVADLVAGGPGGSR